MTQAAPTHAFGRLWEPLPLIGCMRHTVLCMSSSSFLERCTKMSRMSREGHPYRAYPKNPAPTPAALPCKLS